MPRIARIKLPDGRVARVSVPDDATDEQVMAFVKGKLSQRKPAVGKTVAQKEGALNSLGAFLSTGNEMALGALRGLENITSSVTDPLLGMVFGQDKVREAGNSRQRRWDTVADAVTTHRNPAANTAGQIGAGMAVPLSKIGMIGKLGNRAIQGALGGLAVRDSNQSAVPNALTGAVANAVLPPLIGRVVRSRPAQAAGRAVAKMAGRAPDQIPVDGLAALGPDAVERAARLKALGVERPTTGMVTRDPAAYSFEQNTARLTGVGDDLARQMREAEAALVSKGRSMVDDLGGAKGPEATGKGVEETLDAKRTEMQRLTGKIYEEVRETRGDESIGYLSSLRERMSDPDVVDNAVLDQMREGLVRRMTRLGLVSDNGSMSQPITVRQAEELRKFIGGLGSSADPAVRMTRKNMIDALDDDVVEAVGDDAFKAARASARERFQEFSKTFPGKLADEKLAPELLTKRVLGDGVKLSDLRALRTSLTTGTDEQVVRGQAAWRDLQSQSVEDLLGKSIDADGNLVGTGLSREFNKSATKLKEVLDPADFAVMENLAAASRDVKAMPVGHSVNTSNSATTLANMFDNAPPAVKEGWGKLTAKLGLRAGAHAAAGAIAPVAGNIAVEAIRGGASAVASQRAQSELAEALVKRIQLAQSPEAAAAAIREAQEAAASSPVIADMLNRAGLGRMIGGTAAAVVE